MNDVKVGDQVEVLAGGESGKTGKVMEVHTDGTITVKLDEPSVIPLTGVRVGSIRLTEGQYRVIA